MANMIGAVVGLTFSVIMVTTVLIPTIKNVDTSNWTTSEIAMLGLGSLGSIAGIVYGILSAFGVV